MDFLRFSDREEEVLVLVSIYHGIIRSLSGVSAANVNYVGYSSSNYSLVLDADNTCWREFEQKMDNLEEKFRAVSKSAKAYEVGY